MVFVGILYRDFFLMVVLFVSGCFFSVMYVCVNVLWWLVGVVVCWCILVDLME